MTTIINTPPTVENSDSGAGIVIGVVVALIVVVLFFVYALPAIRGSATPTSANLNVSVTIPKSTPTTPATTATYP